MSKKLPAIFVGHGSPMNIVYTNAFTRDLEALGRTLPVPDAIAVVSAHWLTRGTWVTASATPEQIYDFYGFPPDLYRFRYPSPGSPDAAELIKNTPSGTIISTDPSRGIDHAAWTILKYIFPEASIPVLEISIDIAREAKHHYTLGQSIAALREKNILVIGSGNLIHNLGEIDFDSDAKPFGWAEEFDLILRDNLISRNDGALINYTSLGKNSRRAIPFPDHYYPMLYILGMTGQDEQIRFFHDSIQNGSVAMRSFITG
ncbi:MAG: 4,5-DOPA dioxygenase extradiol [Bacteroidales bacterium]